MFEGKIDEEESFFEKQNDDNYNPSNKDDVLLEADEEIDKNLGLWRTSWLRFLNPWYQHLQANKNQAKNYGKEEALLFILVMCHYNNKMVSMKYKEAYSFIQTYSLEEGIKTFGDQGKNHQESKWNSCTTGLFLNPYMSMIWQRISTRGQWKVYFSNREAWWLIQSTNVLQQKHIVVVCCLRRFNKPNGCDSIHFDGRGNRGKTMKRCDDSGHP